MNENNFAEIDLSNTTLASNPDNIPDNIAGPHKGHAINKTGENRYECHTCKANWRMVSAKAKQRKKLLR